jgi:thiamine-phosphate pyrophosphorylase
VKVPFDFGFYGILSEPRAGYPRLTELMVERGVRIIQLRMKHADRAEILEVGRILRTIIPSDNLFIVNDDPAVARDVGADGVHLGQHDAPYDQTRELLGPDAVIGLSTHNPEETARACSIGADYIGVGPVFTTTTKADPDPVIGLDGLTKLLSLATVPAVAIGGISPSNAAAVLAAGARILTAVGCVNQSDRPAEVLDRLLELIQQARADSRRR